MLQRVLQVLGVAYATECCLDQWQYVEGCLGVSVARQMAVLVRSVSLFFMLVNHLLRGRRELCGLHRRGNFASGVAFGRQPKLTLVACDHENSLVTCEFCHTVLSPVEDRCGVLVEEMTPLLYLLSIDAGHKAEMIASFLQHLGNVC